MDNRWKQIGGRTGGTVSGFSVITDGGDTSVFAATAMGLYTSVDTGRSWSPLGHNETIPFIFSVAASLRETNEPVLTIGTHSGLYRSHNGGTDWRLQLSGSPILALATATDSEGGERLLVGTKTDGILRSEDGGYRWASGNPGLSDRTVLALAVSPAFVSDQTGFAATPTGVYRTRSGGKAWREMTLSQDDVIIQCVAISPHFARDHLVLAGTEEGGLLRSRDAGRTWDTVPALQSQDVTAIVFSSHRAQPRITVATSAGIFTSCDSGESWQWVGDPMAPVLSLLSLDSREGEVLLAGLYRRGVARSTDGGETWALANAGLYATRLGSIALSPNFLEDHTMVGVDADDGVVVSRDSGVTWITQDAGLEAARAYAVAVSPQYAHDRTLFAATTAGICRSEDGGETWDVAWGEGGSVSAIAVAPAGREEPLPVFAATATGPLLASYNRAATWHPFGSMVSDTEIIALAASPAYVRDQTIYMATRRLTAANPLAELAVWRSTAKDGNWERVFNEHDEHGLAFAIVAADTAFIGIGGRVRRGPPPSDHEHADMRSAIWEYVRVSNDDRLRITALAVSPHFEKDLTLFVATNLGVFVSWDGARSFASLSEGLSPQAIVALTIGPVVAGHDTLIALGVGGRVWQLMNAPHINADDACPS